MSDFAGKWGWISCIDSVSETCKCDWDKVWEMKAIEFLNILCYARDKREEEKRRIEEWKRRH